MKLASRLLSNPLHISPCKSSRDLRRFPARLSWHCIRRQLKTCQFLTVFGPSFHWSTLIQLHQNWKVGFQHPAKRRHWCAPCPPRSCSQAQKNRQKHPYSSSDLLESKQSHTHLPGLWKGLNAFSFLTPLGPSSDILNVVFLARLPSSLSRKRSRSALSATTSAPRFTDTDTPDNHTGISTSCCSRSVSHDRRPVAFNPEVPHLVCACGLANARDPQDSVPPALQTLSDTLPCEVLLSSHERQRQNTLHSRLSQDTFSSLPSRHGADVAPKEDGQNEDVVLGWPLQRRLPFQRHPKKDREEDSNCQHSIGFQRSFFEPLQLSRLHLWS